MKLYVWLLTIFAAFGGFMFGYDTGVINGVKDTEGFRETFLNESRHSGNDSSPESITESTLLGLVVSTFSLGCLVGALLAAGLSEMMGRKRAIIVGGVVFTAGGAIQTGSLYIWMIILGRIVAGVGVGILSMVVPIYNAELAPSTHRGRLVSLNQLAITAGIMVSFLADLLAARYYVGWRVALGVQCLFGLILIFGMLFLPETPRWLVKKQRNEEAARTLVKVRGARNMREVVPELTDIKTSLKCSSSLSRAETCRLFFTWRIMQRVLIGVLLQLFQQFTGMNVIMYYSTSIFQRIGVAGYISTSVVGALNFLTTILSILLVDKVGRKALLLLGGVGMIVSMTAAATVLLVFGVEEEEEGEGGSVAGYATVVLICFFVFNFAYGWGPVAWVVTSEIYPLKIRGVAVSITTTANWTGNFIIALVTPILLNSVLQTFGTFYLLSGLLLLATLFVLLCLPETKGESLEKIDTLFSKPWLERIDLFYYLRLGCPWGVRRQDSYSMTGGNHPHQRMHEKHGRKKEAKDPHIMDDDRRVLLQQQEMGSENGAELDTIEATFVVEAPNPTGYSISPLHETNN